MIYLRLALAWCLIQVSNLLAWGPAQRLLILALRVGESPKRGRTFFISGL